MCKMLEGGTGGGHSGDARLIDTLNGRMLRGAEFHLLMERGQLKTRGFCSVLACVTWHKAALHFSPETLSPVLGSCAPVVQTGIFSSAVHQCSTLGQRGLRSCLLVVWGNPEAGMILCDPDKERFGEILC